MATKTAEIRYPNGTRSPDDVYPLNSVFTCVGDGFPPPTVEWLDGNKKLIGGRGQGSVTWSAKQQGTYDLICSARNTLSQNTTYNATRVKGIQFRLRVLCLLLNTTRKLSQHDYNYNYLGILRLFSYSRPISCFLICSVTWIDLQEDRSLVLLKIPAGSYGCRGQNIDL